ncbi:MAG: hypothetical protein JSR59_10235 [Proteobacteria bacterium]|nr:hypothetical protein [Pseudomonadota bacterium]
MKHHLLAGAVTTALMTIASTPAAHAATLFDQLIVAASNASANQLMFFNPSGTLLQSLPTEGQGGVSGNAGGIAATRDRIAVVNYGSSNVSVFVRDDGPTTFHLEAIVPTAANPVSVAFANDHLYVLSGTRVESHFVGSNGVAAAADGSAALLHADGTAGQVGATRHALVITEKSNAVETVALSARGVVTGTAVMAANIPSNIDTPLGLVTTSDEAYVTLAHADEISLVRDNAVLTTVGSGTQHAPCWLALDGPFLFSANSPSMSVSRYAVYGQQIVQDAAVAAQFAGNPTDIAYRAGLAAVVDSNGTVSHVNVFSVDIDGNLTPQGVATVSGKTTNGIAIVPAHGH